MAMYLIAGFCLFHFFIYPLKLLQNKVQDMLLDTELDKTQLDFSKAIKRKPVRRDKLYQILETLLGEYGDRDNKNKESFNTHHVIKDIFERTVHILLAEENPVNQKLAGLMLGKAGYDIEIVGNGLEAVEKYKASPETFDLILMDIQMPVMDGFEATDIIRNFEKTQKPTAQNTSYNVPIIAMTAHAMAGYREKCIKSGMNDYISKPIDREKVLETIEKWVFAK